MVSKAFKFQMKTFLKGSGLTKEEYAKKIGVSVERLEELLNGEIPSICELDGICLASDCNYLQLYNVIVYSAASKTASSLTKAVNSGDVKGLARMFLQGKIVKIDDSLYELFLDNAKKIDDDLARKALKLLFVNGHDKLVRKFSTKNLFLTYDDLKEVKLEELYKNYVYTYYIDDFKTVNVCSTAGYFLNTCPIEIKKLLLERFYNDRKEFAEYLKNSVITKPWDDRNILFIKYKNVESQISVYKITSITDCKEIVDKINNQEEDILEYCKNHISKEE